MSKNTDIQSTVITPHLINKADLILKEVIDEGHFGVVIKATWKHPDGNEIECAIKSLKQAPDMLISEIVNTQKLRHKNIVRLYGVCLEKPVRMVLELCEGGTLADRLKDHSKPKPLATTLLKYAIQIAEGMCYLETQEYVHRDLAARNILLTKDEQTAKIADFGLSRQLDNDQYLMSENSAIPFSWCPPESLRSKIFSSHSDSWAFGVTIWEMFQYGKEDPWKSLSLREVLAKLEAGQHLSKPLYCPEEIYKIMLECWNFVPKSRPNFTTLINKLKEFEFELLDLNKMEKTTYEMPIESKNSNALIVIDFDNVNNTFLVQNTSNGNFCIFLPDKKLIEIGNSDFSNFPFVQRGISSSRTDIISSECKPPLLKKPEPFLDQKINNENSILFSKNPTQSSPTTTQYEHERTSTPPLPTRRNRSNKHSWFSRLRDIWSRVIERKWLIVILIIIIIIIIVIAVVVVIVTRNHVCASCTAGQVTLVAGTPTPTASAITFDANGCANLVVTCNFTGSQVLMELNMGAGGTSGPTQDTISEPFVCSAGGIWTFGGQNVAITSLDCVSAAGR